MLGVIDPREACDLERSLSNALDSSAMTNQHATPLDRAKGERNGREPEVFHARVDRLADEEKP